MKSAKIPNISPAMNTYDSGKRKMTMNSPDMMGIIEDMTGNAIGAHFLTPISKSST